jgi:hypothetical protein
LLKNRRTSDIESLEDLKRRKEGLEELAGVSKKTANEALENAKKQKEAANLAKKPITEMATTFKEKFKLMQERGKIFIQQHKINMDALVKITESRRKAFATIISSMGDTFKAASASFTSGLGNLDQALDPRIGGLARQDLIKGVIDQARISREAFEMQKRAAQAQLEFLNERQRQMGRRAVQRHSVTISNGEAAIMALVKEVVRRILIESRSEGGDSCCI